MSTERVIVERSVADSFAEKLSRSEAALPVGDPNDGRVRAGIRGGPAPVQRVQ